MEVIEVDDDEEFLSIIDAVEAKAMRSRKRQKIDDEEPIVEMEEGTYMAALRGSHSSLWQKQQQQQQQRQKNEKKKEKDKSKESGSFFIRGGGSLASEDEKACPCGLGNCLLLTSNTAKNPGRKFYRCPVRAENGGCNFFEWCDNPTSGLPTYGRAFAEGKSPCGLSNLSNEPSSLSRQTAFSSQAQVTYSNNCRKQSSTERNGSSCFKCGQEGHWTRDCTTVASDINAATGSNVAFVGSGSCFKCGKPGHWAKDCSEQRSTARAKDRKASRSSFHTAFINK